MTVEAVLTGETLTLAGRVAIVTGAAGGDRPRDRAKAERAGRAGCLDGL